MRELAGIVLIIDEKLLLVLNDKYAEEYKANWSIPKGKIGSGEEPFEAAKRELEEECGIDLNDFTLDEDACNDKLLLEYSRKGEGVQLHYFVYNLHTVKLNAWSVDDEKIAGIGFFDQALAKRLIKAEQVPLTNYMNLPGGCLNLNGATAAALKLAMDMA